MPLLYNNSFLESENYYGNKFLQIWRYLCQRSKHLTCLSNRAVKSTKYSPFLFCARNGNAHFYVVDRLGMELGTCFWYATALS